MRMCWPTRTFMSGNTYVRAGRYIRTYKSRLNFIRDRKEFSSKRTRVFFEQDWSFLRNGLEFSSNRTGVFFGTDWSFPRTGLELPPNSNSLFNTKEKRACLNGRSSPTTRSLFSLSYLSGHQKATKPASFNKSIKRIISDKLSASGNCASCIFLISKTLKSPETVNFAISSP